MRILFALILATLASTNLSRAAQPEIFTGLVEGVGAGGYDVVSYFSGTATPGNEQHTSQWKNATWRFSSAENKAAFDAAPEKYAPQYGGYCAFGVAAGYAVKGEPEQWSVVNGKLYLNYSADVQAKWKKDIPGYITSADAKWPKVLE